jgi:HK97 family phage portal protein
MGILSRAKTYYDGLIHAASTITNTDPLIQALQLFNMPNYLGAKQRPYNYDAGIRLGTQSWPYAAAMLNARAVSQVPIRMYVKKPSGGRKMAWQTRQVSTKRFKWLNGEGGHKPSLGVQRKAAQMGNDFEEVIGPHPILSLLHTVNQFSNGFDFLMLQVMYLEMIGNTFIMPMLDQRTGVPVALWPLMSQWVTIKPGLKPGDPWIKGYRYGTNYAGMSTIDFDADQLIHIKYPNTRDPYYGLGKAEAGWQILALNDANHNMDLAFVDNMARPDFIVGIKNSQDPATLKRFEADFQRKFRGVANNGSFAAVNGDIDIHPLNFKPKDMAGREETVEEIAAVFGCPVSMLKANDPNKAGAGTAVVWWQKTTVSGICQLIEDALNQSYVPLWGEEAAANTILAFDDPVPQDDQIELKALIDQVSTAIMSRNEARTQLELPPVEGGDELIITSGTGVIPLSMVRATAEATIAASTATTNASNDMPASDKPVNAGSNDANPNLVDEEAAK